MLGCIAIVVGFGSSSNLAAAYGVAVTATMVITTILLGVVARQKWGWGLPLVLALTGFFLVIDLAFFGANIIKIPAGGWFPLVVGAVIFLLMTTWKKGRRILASRMLSLAIPIEDFLRDIAKNPPVRVPGTAVFMNGTGAGTPPALVHNLEHNKVLHERVVLLTVKTRQVPHVEPEERVSVEPLGHEFYRVDHQLRLHGRPEHPERPGRPGDARPRLRPDGDDLLPRPRDGDREQATRHDALAREAVRTDVAQRLVCHRLLLPAARPCRRNGVAGRDLKLPGSWRMVALVTRPPASAPRTPAVLSYNYAPCGGEG